MNLPDLLDLLIGLVLVLLFLSSLTSALSELYSQLTQDRADLLRRSLHQLLAGTTPRRIPLWRRQRLFAGVFGAFRGALPNWLHQLPAQLLRLALLLSQQTAAKSWPWLSGTARWLSRWLRSLNALATPPGPCSAEDPAIVRRFWQHNRISPLVSPGSVGPAFLPPEAFAETCLDLCLGKAAALQGVEELIPELERQAASPHGHGPLSARLLDLARTHRSSGSAQLPLAASLSRWFNDTQQRLSADFRRQLRLRLFVLGTLAAVLINIDLAHITRELATRPDLRALSVRSAERLLSSDNKEPADGKGPAAVTGDAALKAELKASLAEFKRLQDEGFPLGWKTAPDIGPLDSMRSVLVLPVQLWNTLTGDWIRLFGWLLAGLSTTVGAPFWFDMLGRLVSFRSSLGAKGATGPASGAPAEPAQSPAGKRPDPVPEAPRKQKARQPEPTAATVLGTRLVSTAPDPALVHFLGLCANAAYDTGDPRPEFCARLGFASADKLPHAGAEPEQSLLNQLRHLGMPDTQLVLARHTLPGDPAHPGQPARSVLLLAFRGTEGKATDWATDLQCGHEPLRVTGPGATPPPCRVHKGFQLALDRVWPAVQKALAGEKPDLVMLTGHSLGGALATLAAARLCMEQGGHNIAALVTFGCPRSGDPAFADWLDARLGERVLRVVNDLDLVTRVPTRLQGYSHTDGVLFFDAQGRAEAGSEPWQRHLNTLRQLIDDQASVPGQLLADHSMTGYLANTADLAHVARPAAVLAS